MAEYRTRFSAKLNVGNVSNQRLCMVIAHLWGAQTDVNDDTVSSRERIAASAYILGDESLLNVDTTESEDDDMTDSGCENPDGNQENLGLYITEWNDTYVSIIAYGDHAKVDGVLEYVKICAKALKLNGVWGFEWANTCTNMHDENGFGGGAFTVDLATGKTDVMYTSKWLKERVTKIEIPK